MTKVVALMSMSLDGYVADANDGVAEVFDWYFSGDVEVPTTSTTSGMTFRVSAPSADHLRSLMAEIGAMLTGRRTFERADGWGGQHPFDVPAFVATHHVPDGWPRPGSTVHFVTDGIESAVARAKSAAGPKSVGVRTRRRPSAAQRTSNRSPEPVGGARTPRAPRAPANSYARAYLM
jgi:dihydrofolate reductase